jgi:hypothetical protein
MFHDEKQAAENLNPNHKPEKLKKIIPKKPKHVVT